MVTQIATTLMQTSGIGLCRVNKHVQIQTVKRSFEPNFESNVIATVLLWLVIVI